MEELIQKMQNVHGLTAEQSRGILSTIAGYIKEKFPMIAGAIDNIIPAGSDANTPAASTTVTQNNEDVLDKISDFIPGATGEKIEEFAKEKLGGFFGGNKT